MSEGRESGQTGVWFAMGRIVIEFFRLATEMHCRRRLTLQTDGEGGGGGNSSGAARQTDGGDILGERAQRSAIFSAFVSALLFFLSFLPSFGSSCSFSSVRMFGGGAQRAGTGGGGGGWDGWMRSVDWDERGVVIGETEARWEEGGSMGGGGSGLRKREGGAESG